MNVSCTNMHIALPELGDLESASPLECAEASELRVPNSREDRIAYRKMKESVEFVDGHFQLPLLWKHEVQSLPNNKQMAENRLASLKKRLSKDENLHKKYSEVMEEYIKKGYAEPVEFFYTKKCLLPSLKNVRTEQTTYPLTTDVFYGQTLSYDAIITLIFVSVV